MKRVLVVIVVLFCSTLAASAGIPESGLAGEPVRRVEAIRGEALTREARMGHRDPRRERRDDYCRNMPRACR